MQSEQSLLTPVPLIRGRTVFLAGVEWQPVSLRYRNRMKALARSRGADQVVSYRYRDRDGTLQWVAGLVRVSVLALPKNIRHCCALGLLIASQLNRSGYVIVPLDNDRYLFVSSLDGVLMNEVVGDRHTVEQARETFTRFNPEPEGGWFCQAPADWHIDGSQPVELAALLAGRNAAARFHPASVRKPLSVLLVSGVLMLAGYYGWMQYRDHQVLAAQEVARLAVLEQQVREQAAARVTPPWITAPRMMPFMTACATRWQAVPLSLAGWVFKEAQCGQDGMLSVVYRKSDGATVGDFATRVSQRYNGQYTPWFSLPGSGDTGGFSLPVTFNREADERQLPDADTQIQRLTSFAQQRHLPLHLQEDDNRLVSPSGEESLLPWRRFSFSLETPVSPSALYDEPDDVGIRLSRISLLLQQGRLTYKLEGTLYASP